MLAKVSPEQWDAIIAGAPVEDRPPPAAAVKHETPQRPPRPPCARLGEPHPDFVARDGRRLDPHRTPRLCGGCDVYRCELLGSCTRGTAFDGTPCCATCPAHWPESEEDLDAGELEQALAEIAGPERRREPEAHEAWCKSPVVRYAHRVALARQMQQLGDYPGGREGDGVVLVGGGAYAAGNYLHVRLLRELGSQLPVQIWHRGSVEPMPDCVRTLPGVRVIDAETHPLRAEWRALGGWQLKLIAGVHSGFKRWIFSDADNYPVANPDACFKRPWRNAVLWPDFSANDSNIHWDSYGVPAPDDNRGTNGGSAVFDASKCWRALQLAVWLDAHCEYFYQPQWGCGGYGDQDTLRAAFVLTRTPFDLWARRPQDLEGMYVQAGPDGRAPLWVHRVSDKPASPPRWFNPQAPLELRVHEILREFRA